MRDNFGLEISTVFLISEIRRCPAIIFALSRMARVNGRIMFLRVSISAMNGISIVGVLRGRRFPNLLVRLFIRLNEV